MPRVKDEANIQAAQQEAEERKLKRKKQLHSGNSSDNSVVSGVVFSDEEKEVLKEVAGEDLESDAEEKEVFSETLSSRPTESLTYIKITTNGSWEGTVVELNGKKISTPLLKILISKEEISIKMLKEVNLI